MRQTITRSLLHIKKALDSHLYVLWCMNEFNQFGCYRDEVVNIEKASDVFMHLFKALGVFKDVSLAFVCLFYPIAKKTFGYRKLGSFNRRQ